MKEFKSHFEDILNPDLINHVVTDITTDVTISILDEEISIVEVQEQIKRMHPDKASGPDGLPPVVFSLLLTSPVGVSYSNSL